MFGATRRMVGSPTNQLPHPPPPRPMLMKGPPNVPRGYRTHKVRSSRVRYPRSARAATSRSALIHNCGVEGPSVSCCIDWVFSPINPIPLCARQCICQLTRKRFAVANAFASHFSHRHATVDREFVGRLVESSSHSRATTGLQRPMVSALQHGTVALRGFLPGTERGVGNRFSDQVDQEASRTTPPRHALGSAPLTY